MKKRKRPAVAPLRYSVLDEMLASPTEPHPDLTYQLALIRAGIEEMRTAPEPTSAAWEAIADLVNLLESLVDMGEIDDSGGWIFEAAKELAHAGMRFQQGKPLRLTGAGLTAVCNAFEGYELAATNLSARTMVRAHRRTELRVREVRMGKRRSTDTVVVSL